MENSLQPVCPLAAALKFLTYTPGLPCSSFQCEPLSVRPECIRFSIGNVVLKILAWLKVYTDRSLDSPPCDDSPSPQGHSVLCRLTLLWLLSPHIVRCQHLRSLHTFVWLCVGSCVRKWKALCSCKCVPWWIYFRLHLLAVTVSLIGNVSFGCGCVESTSLRHAIHAYNSAILLRLQRELWIVSLTSLKRKNYFLMSQAAFKRLQFKPMHFYKPKKL